MMEGNNIPGILLDVVMPLLTAVAGYFTGRQKRKNDFLRELQSSIDMLAAKNREQMNEILALRDQVGKLTQENAELRQEVAKLQQQLEGVKTITKVRA